MAAVLSIRGMNGYTPRRMEKARCAMGEMGQGGLSLLRIKTAEAKRTEILVPGSIRSGFFVLSRLAAPPYTRRFLDGFTRRGRAMTLILYPQTSGRPHICNSCKYEVER